jgi:Protein of unknown function (DUF1091)
VALTNTTVHQSANQSQFSVYFNLLDDVEDAFLRITVSHFSKGSFVPSLLDASINCCDFFKMKNSIPTLTAIYDHFRRYGKIPDRCPVKKVYEFEPKIFVLSSAYIHYRRFTME